MDLDNEKFNTNKGKEIIKVEPKPIIENKEIDKTKIGNIKINKIGNLTLNIIPEPLKKRYHKYYKKNWLHLLVDLALIAIVIMLLGSLLNIWFFSRTKLINLMDFKVTSSPEVLVNGQETQFNIQYTNTTNDELTNVVIVLKLPASLRNPKFNIENYDLSTHTLKIGNLAAKGQGELTVKGLLLDNFDAKQEFLAVINYKNKYGQDRQEFFNQNFTLSQSVIDAKMVLPEKIIATSPFDGQIFIKNTSDLALKNLKIKLVGPIGFIFIKSDLGNISEQADLIGSLPKDVEKNYKFSGKIYIDKPQTVTLTDEIYASYDDKEYLINKNSASTKVEFSKFILEFSGAEKNQFANPGDKISYQIHYKNTENITLKNVELGLNVKSDYVSQNTFSATKINEIAPNQEGIVDITVPTKTTANFDTYNENGYTVEARIYANYNNNSIESLPLITKLSSRLILNTAAVFFTPEGDQIGVGTVPPQVNEYTSYWAVIKIINTNNKVHNVKVIAQLPQAVDFTNIYNVTAGNQIIYHKDTNQIEWQIEEIPVLAGIYNPAPEARIQLAITPTENQIGQSPALLSSISATATDEVTGALLSAGGKNVTTEISIDNSLNKVVQ